jgi:hypothetical protein
VLERKKPEVNVFAFFFKFKKRNEIIAWGIGEEKAEIDVYAVPSPVEEHVV